MEKVRSSVFLKTFAFLFHQLFFIVCAITVYIGITYWNYDDATFDILEQEDFTKTNYYKRLVEETIYDLIRYVQDCEKFQTAGKNDTSRIVDIYDYVQNDRISGEATYSLGYTLHDLLAWQEEGFVYETVTLPLDTYDQNAYTEERLVETYQNSAGIPLSYYAQVEQKDYNEVCGTLEQAARKAAEEYASYRSLVSVFKANNTNLRYAFYNGISNQLYTNLNISDISDGISRIKDLETYMTLNSATSDFDSNLLYAGDQLNQYLNALYEEEDNYTIAIGVDATFPVLDTFHKEMLRYNTFERWFKTLYKLFIISIMGYAMSFIYLSVCAGCSRRSSGISLNFLDGLKLEILILLLSGGEFLCWRSIMLQMNQFSLPTMNLSTLVHLSLFSLLANLLFSICYLSFLRRAKAHVLWKSSLLFALLQLLQKLRSNRILILKALICYGLIVLGTLYGLQITELTLLVLALGLLASVVVYFLLRSMYERHLLIDGSMNIADGNLDYQIDTRHLMRENRLLGSTINHIRDVLQDAVEDSIKNERLKTNLITNVSHDIKTPLTSIINYVTLLQNIPIEDEKAKQYIQILDDKSQRLKHLTEDLMEASKISSNNITLEKTRLNLTELVTQTSGEFYERFEQNSLTLITMLPEHALYIDADGRRIWRILENIYSNAIKYSQKHTRVYAQLTSTGTYAEFTLKNISAQPLNISSDDLTKRFVRGDVSRSTEGSGLGLSIAKDLTKLHGGTFDVSTNGDLFCITILLPLF